MVDVTDCSGAVRERSDPVAVADKNIASVQLKGTVRQISAPAEVVENLFQAAVGARDGVVARAWSR